LLPWSALFLFYLANRQAKCGLQNVSKDALNYAGNAKKFRTSHIVLRTIVTASIFSFFRAHDASTKSLKMQEAGVGARMASYQKQNLLLELYVFDQACARVNNHEKFD
jgi:hypothetical protein